MTLFLGWLLGSITFAAGWATRAAFVEHNAPRLVVHPEQQDFANDCARCGIPYASGDRHAVAEHLVALGLAYRDGDRIEPTRLGLTPIDGAA